MYNIREKRIPIIRYGARTLLLIITTFWFVFALLSGAEQYGGGLMGIIKNSPNALPWLALYLINLLTWKLERIGGLSLIICALLIAFAFDVLKGNWGVLLIGVVPLLLLGVIFVYCSYKSNNSHL